MAARRDVGVLFQNPENQLVAECVEDDVAFGLENLAWAPAEMLARVDEMLARFGLTDLRRREPHLLSGGQKQRTALAGVLAVPRRVLCWTNRRPCSTRPGGRRCSRPCASCAAEGLAIVYVTQEMDEVVGADRVVALEAGAVVYEGAVAGLFGDGELVATARARPAGGRRAGAGTGRPRAARLAAAADRSTSCWPRWRRGREREGRHAEGGCRGHEPRVPWCGLQLRGGARRHPGAARRELRAARRKVAGAARRVRVRQVDPAAGDQGAGRAGGRRRACWTGPAPAKPATPACSDRSGWCSRRPSCSCSRRRRGRTWPSARAAWDGRRPRWPRPSTRRWSWWGCRRTGSAGGTPTRSPAASSAAWRSPACWPCGRACCFSTSRS